MEDQEQPLERFVTKNANEELDVKWREALGYAVQHPLESLRWFINIAVNPKQETPAQTEDSACFEPGVL